MNKITIDHPEAHEKLTARLFWKRVQDSGYNDAGNVTEYIDASTRSLVTRARAKTGARFVNNEQADVCHEAYTCKLDERVPAQEELIKLAKSQSDGEQIALEGATGTIENVQKGKWYPIGAYNVADLSVSGALSGLLEEGTDYAVETESGRIFLEPDGEVSNGESLNLIFDEPGIIFERAKSQCSPLFYCDVIIEEYNQYSKLWLRRKSFRAYLNVTAFPTHTGPFGTYDVKITPASEVIEDKRPEAATLPISTGGGVAGNSSSSSSSHSSASSRSSKSSASSYSSNSSTSSLSMSSHSSASSQSSNTQSFSSPSSQSSASSYSSHSSASSQSSKTESSSSHSSQSSNSSSSVRSYTSSSSSSMMSTTQ